MYGRPKKTEIHFSKRKKRLKLMEKYGKKNTGRQYVKLRKLLRREGKANELL